MMVEGKQITKQSKAPLEIGKSGLKPKTLEELWRMAQMASMTGFVPSNLRGKPEECMVAMSYGMEIGLGPIQSCQSIAVINGRPSIWGDAMIGLVLASDLMADQSLEYTGKPGTDTYTAVYSCTRKGFSGPSVSRYSVADAKKAGLWGKRGPWSDYPDRMLGIRARAFGLRNNFADVLGGLYMAEEFGVTREAFDPDRMAQNPAPSLERVYGNDEQEPEPEVEVIEDNPIEQEDDPIEVDPDTGEVIPDYVGKGDALFIEDDREQGYI